MASGNPDVRTVACPSCGSKYEFPAAMTGRRGRCAHCGHSFAVPTRPLAPQAAKPAASKYQPETSQAECEPQYIGLDCRVCQTRMYGLRNQVGKKLKCPDCGAMTEVPEPPPRKKPNMPAAL